MPVAGAATSACRGVPRLLVAFFSSNDAEITVEGDGGTVVVTVDGCSCELSRADAAQLQEAVGDALTERREFVRTAGEHREDGAYVVERRGADSSGNAKVFESFEHLRRLYGRLPERFGADEVGRAGITGSRRHMLVRHFAEHPAFDCSVECRNPLTAEKAGDGERGSADESAVDGDGPTDESAVDDRPAELPAKGEVEAPSD